MRGWMAGALVGAVLVAGSGCTVVETVPSHGETPGRVAADVSEDARQAPTAMARWAACVTYALTTPGMGGDGDMHACDREYWQAGGEGRPWLYCPGRPEAGGCRGNVTAETRAACEDVMWYGDDPDALMLAACARLDA